MFLEIPVALSEASLEAAQMSLQELAEQNIELGVGFSAKGSTDVSVGLKLPEMAKIAHSSAASLVSLSDIASSTASGIKETKNVVNAINRSIRVMSKTSPMQAIQNILATPIRLLSGASDAFVAGATSGFSSAAKAAFDPLTKDMAAFVSKTSSEGLQKSGRRLAKRAGFDDPKDVAYIGQKIAKSMADPVRNFERSVKEFSKISKDFRAGGIERVISNSQKQFKQDLKKAYVNSIPNPKKGKQGDLQEKAFLEMIQAFMALPETLADPSKLGGLQVRKILGRNNDLLSPIRGQRVASQANSVIAKFDSNSLKTFTESTLKAASEGKQIVKPLYAAEDRIGTSGTDQGFQVMLDALKRNVYGNNATFDIQDELENTIHDFVKAIAGGNEAISKGVGTALNMVYGSESAEGVAEEILAAIQSGIPGSQITMAGHSSGGSRASQTLSILDTMSETFTERAKESTGDEKKNFERLAKELRDVKAFATGGGIYEPNQRNFEAYSHKLDKFVGGLRQAPERGIKRTTEDMQIDHGVGTYLEDPRVLDYLKEFLGMELPARSRYDQRVFREEADKVNKADSGKKRGEAMTATDSMTKRIMVAPTELAGLGRQISATMQIGLQNPGAASNPGFEAAIDQLSNALEGPLSGTDLETSEEFGPYVQALKSTMEQFKSYLKAAQTIVSKGLPDAAEDIALEKLRDRTLEGPRGRSGMGQKMEALEQAHDYMTGQLQSDLRSDRPVDYPEPAYAVKAQVVGQGSSPKEFFERIKNITDAFKENPTRAVAKVANEVEDLIQKVAERAPEIALEMADSASKGATTFYNLLGDAVGELEQARGLSVAEKGGVMDRLADKLISGFRKVDSARVKGEDAFKRFLPEGLQNRIEAPPELREQLSPAVEAKLIAAADTMVTGLDAVAGGAEVLAPHLNTLARNSLQAAKAVAQIAAASAQKQLAPAKQRTSSINDPQLIASSGVKERSLEALTKAQLQRAITRSRGANVDDNIAQGMSADDMRAELSIYNPKQLGMLLSDAFRKAQGKKINEVQAETRSQAQSLINSGDLQGASDLLNQGLSELRQSRTNISGQAYRGLEAQLKQMMPQGLPTVDIDLDESLSMVESHSMGIAEFFDRVVAAGKPFETKVQNLGKAAQEVFEQLGGAGDYRKAFNISPLRPSRAGAAGSFNNNTNELRLDDLKALLKGDRKQFSTFVHEVTHAIQKQKGSDHRPMQLTPDELIHLPALAAKSTSLDPSNMVEIIREMEAYGAEVRAAMGPDWVNQIEAQPVKATPEIIQSYMKASQEGLGSLSSSDAGVSYSMGLEAKGQEVESFFGSLLDSLKDKIKPHLGLVNAAAPKLGGDLENVLNGGGELGVFGSLKQMFTNLGTSALKLFASFKVLTGILSGSVVALEASERFAQLNRQIKAASKGTEDLASITKLAQDNNVSSKLVSGVFTANTLATQGTANEYLSKDLSVNLGKVAQAYGLNAEQSGRLAQAATQVAGKGRLQAEEARGQIGEVVPGFMTAVAQSKGMSVEQLDGQFRDGAVSLADFNRALVIAAQQAGGGQVTLGAESSKLAESMERLQAGQGELLVPLSLGAAQLGNQLVEVTSQAEPILKMSFPAALLMSAATLGILARAALTSAYSMAKSVYGFLDIKQIAVSLVKSLAGVVAKFALLTVALASVTSLIEGIRFGSDIDDITNKEKKRQEKDENPDKPKAELTQASGILGVVDAITSPLTILSDKISGIKSDRDFLEKVRAGDFKVGSLFNMDSATNARGQALSTITKVEGMAKTFSEGLPEVVSEARTKVTPINEQLEAAKAELVVAEVGANMDSSPKNIEARNAAAEKVSRLESERNDAMSNLTEYKGSVDAALEKAKENLDKNPLLAPELEPQIAQLEKASKKAGVEINNLTNQITSNAKAQQKAYFEANKKLAITASTEEKAQAGFDAQRVVARAASGQLGSFDANQANAQIDLQSLNSATAAAQANLDAAGEGIKGTSKNLRLAIEKQLGKSVDDASSQEIQVAAEEIKRSNDSFDASQLIEFAKIRDESVNKLTQSSGEVVRKQTEFENSVFERNQAIADYLRDANRKVEDQAIEFASAQADLAESATSLSINAKISKMKSDMNVAAARAQSKFAGIADDFTGNVVNGILSWFETMNQSLTGTLEKQLAQAQAEADRRAQRDRINSFNLSQQRAEEDSALEGKRFSGGQTKFEGVQITSAIDASGEPGLDYVVDNGKKGAPVGSVTEGKVIEIKRNQKEIHKEKGEQGRSAGNVVIVRSVDPKTGKEADLLYAHFDKIAVALGDIVKVGDVLGTQGRTGSTTGAHVSLDFYGKDANAVSEASDNLRRQTLAGLQSGSLNAQIKPRSQSDSAPQAQTQSKDQPSADAFVGAVLSILEAGDRQDRVDVAQVIANRAGSNFDGYGTSIRDQAFAQNQFQPFFSKGQGGYGIKKNQIQDRESAIGALVQAKFSRSEAESVLDEFFKDIASSARTNAAESFVQGRAFFKGTSEQGSMQAGDKIRNNKANYFHYEGTNQAGAKITPINRVFGKGGSSGSSYSPSFEASSASFDAPTYTAKTLTDQGNMAAIDADLSAKLQQINDEKTIAVLNAKKQLKETQLTIKKQEVQNKLEKAQSAATEKLNSLKASTPATDEIGQQKISLLERQTQNELDRGKIEVELVDAKGGLEILQEVLADRKSDPLITPEVVQTMESAIAAQKDRIGNLSKSQALVGSDRNLFDDQYKMEQLISEQRMRALAIDAEVAQGVQNPYSSQVQQLAQKEAGMDSEFAQKAEAYRLEMAATKQTALNRASSIAGDKITDLAEALRILSEAAAGGDKDAEGLTQKLTALQRASLSLPEQLQRNKDIQRKQAEMADRATNREGQSKVLSAMSGAMNNPYRDQAYYSPMQEQILIAQNQIQLAESLQWVDDNAGALGAIGVSDLKDQLTQLSQISLKNSIAELDTVRLGLKNTFQNSFQSFFADIRNGELSIGEVFSNLGQNILNGIVDQFATIASDRMSSMLAQAIPGGNLTNKAGLGMNGKSSQMPQVPSGFQVQGTESMVQNPLLGVASGLLGGGQAAVPGTVPVSVVNAAPGNIAGVPQFGGDGVGMFGSIVGGLSGAESFGFGGEDPTGGILGGLLGGGQAMPGTLPVTVVNGMPGIGAGTSGLAGSLTGGGAGMAGGAGAGMAGGPWGMIAMLGLSLGAGLLSKSKKKKEPPDAQDDWEVAADWKPAPGAINWGSQYKQQVADYSASLKALNGATENAVQVRQNELKASQANKSNSLMFKQNVNVQASNLRSFKQSEKQVGATAQDLGQKNFSRLG
jgi:tape measure domain-containing protein